MSLLSIWASNPGFISEKKLSQVVAIAGSGLLLDASDCSDELRGFLQQVDSAMLERYVGECLDPGFDRSGQALQDVVNEIGRRLEFQVENGLYAGKVNAIGFDGIWSSPQTDFVVEVKTTDTYNVKLDQIASYRQKLADNDRIRPDSSILFVVGRQDTGALEAQIRGSRHAWSMRVIGAASLIRLLRVAEKSSSSATLKQIRSVLQPVEYTRVDRLADIIFETTTEVEAQAAAEAAPDVGELATTPVSGPAEPSGDAADIEQIRAAAVQGIAKKLGAPLVKKRRAGYASPDGSTRVCVVVSKHYASQSEPYWYAFHEAQEEFLGQAEHGWFALACTDRREAYLLPLSLMVELKAKMNPTVRPDRTYWHVKGRPVGSEYNLVLSRSSELLPLTPYVVPLAAAAVEAA